MIMEPTKSTVSLLEKAVWALDKAAHLIKDLEASKTLSIEDHARDVVEEAFPELVSKTSRNGASTTAPVASLWSGTGTTQLIRGLQVRNISSRLTPQSQEPVEEYPALPNSAEFKTVSDVPGTLDAGATQFWSSLRERIACVVDESARAKSENREELGVVVVGPAPCRNQKRRRWAPLKI
jgi:hypothetical protein